MVDGEILTRILGKKMLIQNLTLLKIFLSVPEKPFHQSQWYKEYFEKYF